MCNKTQNLYSKRDVAVFWERHILDSLKINDLLKGEEVVADVGSGGGLPGIPLAIVNREKRFILIERREKKALFLVEAKRVMGLNNIEVIKKNFEEITNIEAKVFVSRGVKLESRIIAHSRKLVKKGRYIYFKGQSFDLSKYTFLKDYKTEEKKEILIVYL